MDGVVMSQASHKTSCPCGSGSKRNGDRGGARPLKERKKRRTFEWGGRALACIREWIALDPQDIAGSHGLLRPYRDRALAFSLHVIARTGLRRAPCRGGENVSDWPRSPGGGGHRPHRGPRCGTDKFRSAGRYGDSANVNWMGLRRRGEGPLAVVERAKESDPEREGGIHG